MALSNGQELGLHRQPWTAVETKMVEKLVLDYPAKSLTWLGKDAFREGLFPGRSEDSVRQKVFKVGPKVRGTAAPPTDPPGNTPAAGGRLEPAICPTLVPATKPTVEEAPRQPDELADVMQLLVEAIDKQRSHVYAQRLREVLTLIKEPDTKQALALLTSVIQHMETGGHRGGRAGG